VTGFGVSREDLAAVGKAFQAKVGPLEGKANEVAGSPVSGGNAGEPFHYAGEQYRALMNEISKGVHDYALRVTGIANALGDSADTYGSIDADNARNVGSVKAGD
jgi:methyl-accepting chemotaxis protein